MNVQWRHGLSFPASSEESFLSLRFIQMWGFLFFYFIGIVWSNNVDIQKTNQRKTVTEFNWVIDWVFLTALVFRMQTEA